MKSKKEFDKVLQQMEDVLKGPSESIELAIRDMIIYGTGIIKINLDYSVEHVPYLDWLNMSKEEKCECTQLSV